MKLNFKFKNETKTCYRFETNEGGKMTIYLKKAVVDEAGINPQGGVVVTVEQAKGVEA